MQRPLPPVARTVLRPRDPVAELIVVVLMAVASLAAVIAAIGLALTL